MVGKGYVYTTELVNFFRMETERILREDKEEFDREMLGYVSKHMYSYNELNRGCIAVMGYGWTSIHLAVSKEEAVKRQEEFNAKKDRYTYHRLSTH
jgi:hypothetical protein